MAIPPFLLDQIRALRRASSEWFSIEEIKKRDKDIEIAEVEEADREESIESYLEAQRPDDEY